MSPLHQHRLKYQPSLPSNLKDLAYAKAVPMGEKWCQTEEEIIRQQFPCTFDQPSMNFTTGKHHNHTQLKVGVVLSGGQAPGGHNVITGIFDALQAYSTESLLYGFCNGADGILKNETLLIDAALADQYRNQGGFDMIGSSRTKLETPNQLEASLKTARELDLDGLVIIGGDDSNTNAAFLAEYFKAHNCKTCVVGVPKTIDGDLTNKYIEASFGFDTACKIYSELIGNIARDAFSAKKYYFFIKLMGRSASHITLECAMQTHPNIALIGEEIAAKNITFSAIIKMIADLICKRAERGKNYGVILVSEGLIEFIPEFHQLINELNAFINRDDSIPTDHKIAQAEQMLTPPSLACFKTLPTYVQRQLLFDRDPHGNVQVSKIETEKLINDAVYAELKKRHKNQQFTGKFRGQNEFFGYEGRSGLPSNFDCQYCYSLGYVATALINNNLSGYMSCIKNLAKPVDQWKAIGVPLTSMMHIELRHGEPTAVIKKSHVDLSAPLFAKYKKERKKWTEEDSYRYPGPIQFFGPSEVTEATTISLQENEHHQQAMPSGENKAQEYTKHHAFT
ncbi:MAG: diphosphate--fructose-6-phosphate 1-phosphotransferase [Chlamydiota bacterium]